MCSPSEGSCADRLDALARGQARRLAAIARREGISGPDALDVVQDAFETLLGRGDLGALCGRPDEAARLLATITRNAARNARRRHHRAKVHASIDEVALADADPLPDRAAELAATTARVSGCLRALDDRKRQIVRLRVLEELSGPEVGRALGLEVSHVAVLLHRARAELERCLATCGQPAGLT
jgi:RNA polymerase sigma-70 factor, ECF subfamily